jgi:hypothetical protein
MSLHEYIEQVRSGLQTLDDHGLSERIDFSTEIRPGGQAVLKATVAFIDTSELYIREFLIEQDTIQHLSYAYQYQKQDGTLIFRYDNAKHRSPLGFDHQKLKPKT